MVSELSSELNTELQDNPFKGIGDLALQSIQIQWGWALLLIGSGLLLAAGILELISSYKSNRNLKQFVPYVAVTALVVFSVIAISHFNKNHPKFKSEQSESLNKAKNKNDERKIQYINPPSSNQEIQKIKKEIKRIPKNEYGQEPSSPCRDEDSPGGRGYYKVGTELLIGDSLSEAVYVARGYCTTMFGGSQRTYCKSGVDMAIRNMSNVQKCYKELFNMDVPNPTD